ncbi:hypothetical protein TNCV_2896051 [Trichonephila clavipes]|nr:hypothetical protein TNCV_2896051 [Trichonephila clavipes]
MGADEHEQMSRSGGQPEAKPLVFCPKASLVLIYRPTEGMRDRVDLAQPKNRARTCGTEAKQSVMSRRKQQLAFDQVSEFDRGRIVAYRDCGLSFREIGSRVGRNQTTVMWI